MIAKQVKTVLMIFLLFSLYKSHYSSFRIYLLASWEQNFYHKNLTNMHTHTDCVRPLGFCLPVNKTLLGCHPFNGASFYCYTMVPNAPVDTLRMS